MTRLILILTVLQTLIIHPFLAVAQKKGNYKIHYTKYSDEGKVIKDTTIFFSKYPKSDNWTFLIGHDTIRIELIDCNCQIQIYDNGFLTESLFDPLENDTTYFEWHQYHYNQKGQLQSDTYKMMNLPWMTENYKYDDKGRLKKEISNTARYGDYSVEYVYDNEKLIMKITNDNNQMDTLRIKTE